MPVRGDFTGLRKLAAALERVASESFRRQCLDGMADGARTQIAAGFASERDPSGTPWAPLKARTGRILRRSGRLASAFEVRSDGQGLTVRNATPYAGFHQQGTRRMPRRAMLPSSRHGGLGRLWSRAFSLPIRQLLHRTLRR